MSGLKLINQKRLSEENKFCARFKRRKVHLQMFLRFAFLPSLEHLLNRHILEKTCCKRIVICACLVELLLLGYFQVCKGQTGLCTACGTARSRLGPPEPPLGRPAEGGGRRFGVQRCPHATPTSSTALATATASGCVGQGGRPPGKHLLSHVEFPCRFGTRTPSRNHRRFRSGSF